MSKLSSWLERQHSKAKALIAQGKHVKLGHKNDISVAVFQFTLVLCMLYIGCVCSFSGTIHQKKVFCMHHM